MLIVLPALLTTSKCLYLVNITFVKGVTVLLLFVDNCINLLLLVTQKKLHFHCYYETISIVFRHKSIKRLSYCWSVSQTVNNPFIFISHVSLQKHSNQSLGFNQGQILFRTRTSFTVEHLQQYFPFHRSFRVFGGS